MVDPTDVVSTKRWIEALSWHEKLTEAGAPMTNAIIQNWQAWYSDPENQRLFNQLSQIVDDTRLVRRRQRWWKSEASDDDYDPSVPIAEWRRTKPQSVRGVYWPLPGKWWLWLAGGVAATAVAVVGGLFLFAPWRSMAPGYGRGGAITFQTNVGGLRDLHLSDGSEVILGGRTILSASISDQARSVRLIRGEAWFRVARDQNRPFIVRAGNGLVRALGTAFDIARQSDRVVVTVTEGTVVITAPPVLLRSVHHGRGSGPQQPAAIRITRGEAAGYGDNGALAPVVRADTRAATAWRQGLLIFDDEPLRYVIDSVDRYSSYHIAATPAAGSLRFSGVVFSNEIEDWLRGLPQIFPVNVTRHDAAICVQMRTGTTNTPCDAAASR